MKINGSTKQVLLDDLRPTLQEDGDLTISEAATSWRVGRTAAKTILENGVENGEFKKLWGYLSKRKVGWIYRPVKGE